MEENLYLVNYGISELPAVVITKILSNLNWSDKLNATVAIKSWSYYLKTHSSWASLFFCYVQKKNTSSKEEELLDSFLICVENYGQYMKHIGITYNQEESASLYRLLNTIFKYCSKLESFELKINPNTFQTVWLPLPCLQAYLEIIKSPKLKETYLKINESAIVTQDFNLFDELLNFNLENKFKSLEVGSSVFNSWMEGIDFQCLKKFHNLKYLEIDQIKVESEILLFLAKRNLQELTLCQEDDQENGIFVRFDESFWEKLVKLSPQFRLNLVLINVDIVGSSLTPVIPLNKLFLDGMTVAYTLTKSVLFDISDNYHRSLKSFYLHNSYLNEMTDSTIEVALLKFVEKCEHLEELHYDYPIDSSTVLLLAKLRRFKSLQIIGIEVNFVNEQHLRMYPEYLLNWLKQCEYGYDMHSLEGSVSKLLGYQWFLTSRGE